MTGYTSTFLVKQQEHAAGKEAFFNLLHGDLHRGTEWTDQDGKAGDLASSPWQVLPAGEYTALLQVWSEHAGKPVGWLIAEGDGGTVFAEQKVVTRSAEHGDWQRVLLPFRLKEATRARVRFRYEGGTPMWTGAMHLARGGRRPIYVIGHNRNTPAQVDQSLQRGANAIEVDLSYRDGKIMAAEVPPLPGWTEISEAGEWLRHAQSVKDKWAFLYVDCKLHEVPDGNMYKYGQELAALFRAAGVDPKRCMFSVPDPSGRDIQIGLRDSGFADSSWGMDGIDDNSPQRANPGDWVLAAEANKLQFIGMGRINLELQKPLALWWEIVEHTVAARDQGKPYPKKIVFWSLHEKPGMRKVLDLGVDGIIADEEPNLCQVLEEEPYRSFCRKALPTEWDPFHAFGIDG
ncbi:MAG TPA: hypothetical protein VND93_29335 [Myxococcales bacterium]|nr:hypothetical protein [Myxococcales bacterium]